MKSTNTSILIVCEGTKTEPWFFRKLIEWLKKQGKEINYFYDIYPTPQKEGEEEDEEDSDIDKSTIHNCRKTSGRKTHNIPNNPELNQTGDLHIGGNPLNWVKWGISKSESYSEVFIVFDKDKHPKMQEAYELVESKHDKKITIILNSRSFEYYMLLHFETIYRSFDKTECGEKRNGHTRSFKCCLPNAKKNKECKGTVCINGYARLKGYWTKSKDEFAFMTATNIWRGMANGEKIRQKALEVNPAKATYELNPYVDAQKLIARLMNMKILRTGEKLSIKVSNNDTLDIVRQDNTLEITNNSPILPIKLKPTRIEYYSYPSSSATYESIRNKCKSESEAISLFNQLQGERTPLCSDEFTTIDPQSSITYTLAKFDLPNTFAVLVFQRESYLIFNCDFNNTELQQ